MIKIFSYSWTRLVMAAGDIGSAGWNISIPNKTFKLKSVFLNCELYVDLTLVPIPVFNNPTQKIKLQIGTGENGSLTNIVTDSTLLPVNEISNGGFINIYQPGQYSFDSVYIRNVLPFYWTGRNMDAVLDYHHEVCVIVEIEQVE
jgi:hypothetical protein